MVKNSDISITIVIPALNEENVIKKTVLAVQHHLESQNVDCELILINDGSVDSTGLIMDELKGRYSNIIVIHHDSIRNIGSCFKEGLNLSSKDAITWFPADGENNPEDLTKYLALLGNTDIIIPYPINTYVRPLSRRILSYLFCLIINLSFRTSFKYTNGNVIYRKDILKDINLKSEGFFFQTELMIKSIKRGRNFKEIPITLNVRSGGKSKAISLKNLLNIVTNYISLVKAIT